MANFEEDKRELLAEEGGEDGAQEMENVVDATTSVRAKPRRVRRRVQSSSSSSGSCRSCRTTCAHGLCTVMLMAVAGSLCLAVGLFVGQSLGRKVVRDREGGTTAPPPTTCAPGSGVDYNWGDSVVDSKGKRRAVADIFKEGINESDISAYLETLTESPHIAGSDKNRELAEMIYTEWTQYGFDSLELVNYTVLLSYPNASQPNNLTLKRADGDLIYTSHIQQEPPLTPGEESANVAAPFNAYSGSGTVKGRLVYVNYAQLSDFQYLTNSSGPGLNLSNHNIICIARYGRIFRGDKAHLAQRYGCKGLLIFSDPHDYAPEGVQVYPNGPSLPEFGVQRGSLMITEGDVLTPGVPAIPGVHRRDYSEALEQEAVPRIPVQPISYGDAVHFMSQLTDHTPPEEWMGGLDIDYKITQSEDNDNYTELTVNSYQKSKMIHNVVAKLYGAVEPDRQVILGNHRDAWVFGAVDPNSGTASLMSLAKVIGQLRQDYDWRAGRTLVLCSWDAEEYGLIGSTEWVEDFGKLLADSTMAYLNVDVAVTGSQFISVAATPILYEVLWQAAKMVDCPNEGFDTVYDEWLNATEAVYNGVAKPLVGNLGSGSDFTAFLQFHGISCSSMSYSNGTGYAVYHSVHDNYYWMSHFGDPPFTHHRAMATVWIMAALILSTTPLPPIDPTHYSSQVLALAQALKDKYGHLLDQNGISLDYLLEGATDFAAACAAFQKNLTKLHSSPTISQQLNLIRIVNDKLMNLERAFIHPEGLPGRPYFKHLIYAPSSVNSYGSSLFPGISDTIFLATESEGSWEEVSRQVDLVGTHLRYASQVVKEPSLHFAPTT